MNYQTLKYKEWLDEAREQFNGTNINRLAMSDLTTLMAEKRRASKFPRSARIHQDRESRARSTSFPTAGEIVNWFREAHGLTPGDFIKGSEVADEWYKTNNITPINGDLNRLAGAIRTYLSRERD